MNEYKIFLIDVVNGEFQQEFFPFNAHCYGLTTTNIYTGITDPVLDLETSIGFQSDLKVGSISVQRKFYKRVDTRVDLVKNENDSSYYYEEDTGLLIIHFEDHKSPYDFSENAIEIGLTLGFYRSLGATSNDASLDGVFNGTQYEPRMKSIPVIKDSRDDLYFSRQKLNGASVEIDNHDLQFRKFSVGRNVRKKTGNFVRCLIWSGDDLSLATYDNFTTIYQGVIEKIREGREIKLNLRDLRSNLKIKSPNRYLDTAEWPNIKNPDKDRLLPEVYGDCSHVPCECLNEEGNPLDYTFLICDSSDPNDNANVQEIGAITEVYVNGQATGLTPTVQYDATQKIAYFELERINFAVFDGSDLRYENMDKVDIDVSGYDDGNGTVIKNGMKIIRLVLLRNYGVPFTDTFYDTATWNTFEGSSTDYEIGYYLDKPKETDKIIADLATSMIGEFRIGTDLRYTFKNDDYSGIAKEITKYEVFPADYFPVVDIDSTKVLSVFRVGYNVQWKETESEKKFTWHVDNTNESTALVQYGSTFQKDFTTYISKEADMLDYAVRILKIGGISDDRLNIKIPWEKGLSLSSGEYVAYEADHPQNPVIGWVICQIQQISPDVNNWQWNVELRIFEYGPYFTILKEDGTKALVTEDGLKALIVENYGSIA